MNKLFSMLWKLLLISAIGLVGSLTLGLMMHGSYVFDPKGAEFAYIAFGASGAFIFAFYHVRGLSDTITAAVSVSAVQFVIASVWMPILNSVVWSFGVNIPVVWLAFLFERKLSAFHWGKFVVVGVVYGTMFVLLTLIVGVLSNLSAMPAIMFRDNFVDGLLIGLGMGLGVQGGEAFIQSLHSASWTTHREY
jgi:hypothetical protein